VWVATALLHREHPDRVDFTAQEIKERAKQENIYGLLRPGVFVHASQQCVANRKPNPGRYRMLFATERGRRRLFRPGDPYHPERRGAKTVPNKANLPPEYQHLIDWYEQVYAAPKSRSETADPILALRGVGRDVWIDEEPDAYVQRLRRDWA
jgi:hypothetical protein